MCAMDALSMFDTWSPENRAAIDTAFAGGAGADLKVTRPPEFFPPPPGSTYCDTNMDIFVRKSNAVRVEIVVGIQLGPGDWWRVTYMVPAPDESSTTPSIERSSQGLGPLERSSQGPRSIEPWLRVINALHKKRAISPAYLTPRGYTVNVSDTIPPPFLNDPDSAVQFVEAFPFGVSPDSWSRADVDGVIRVKTRTFGQAWVGSEFLPSTWSPAETLSFIKTYKRLPENMEEMTTQRARVKTLDFWGIPVPQSVPTEVAPGLFAFHRRESRESTLRFCMDPCGLGLTKSNGWRWVGDNEPLTEPGIDSLRKRYTKEEIVEIIGTIARYDRSTLRYMALRCLTAPTVRFSPQTWRMLEPLLTQNLTEASCTLQNYRVGANPTELLLHTTLKHSSTHRTRSKSVTLPLDLPEAWLGGFVTLHRRLPKESEILSARTKLRQNAPHEVPSPPER